MSSNKQPEDSGAGIDNARPYELAVRYDQTIPQIVTQNAVLAQALACVRDFRALEIPYDEYSMHLVRVFTRRFALPLNA